MSGKVEVTEGAVKETKEGKPRSKIVVESHAKKGGNEKKTIKHTVRCDAQGVPLG